MEQYKYFAFISYTHKDEKVAKWLQRKIETYKLPSSLQKKYNQKLPKNLKPVFRDKTDISKSGKIDDIINPELDKAKYLVVICSRNSEKSKGVSKEIQRFKEQSRENNIIPFIIEDISDSKDTNKLYYPPGIDTETLGISIPQLGKPQAATKVISQMLDLDYNVLWDRHKERQIKQILLAAAIIVVTVLTFAITIKIQSNKIAEQRDKALINESLILNEYAKQNIKHNILKSIDYCLKALPQNLDNPNRPYVQQAENALRNLDYHFESDSLSLLLTFQQNRNNNRHFIFTPDEKKIISNFYNKFSVVDILSGEEDVLIDEYEGNYQIVPDGKKAFLKMEKELIMWDLESKTKVIHIKDSSYISNFDIFHRANMFAFMSSRGHLLYDLKTGNLIMKLPKEMNNNKIIFSEDGKYFIVKESGQQVLIYSSTNHNVILEIKTGYPEKIMSVAFSPRDQTLAYATLRGENGMIKVLDISSKIEIYSIKTDYSHFLNTISFSMDGSKVMGFMPIINKFGVWDINSDKITEITHNINDYPSVLHSQDGKTFCLFNNENMELWDLKKNTFIASFKIKNENHYSLEYDYNYQYGKILEIRYCANGERLLIETPESYLLVNAHNGQIIREFEKKLYHDIELSYDGELIVHIRNQTATLINPLSGEENMTIKHDGFISNVRISKDNSKIVISDGSTIKLWQISNLNSYKNVPRSWYFKQHFTPDSKFLIIWRNSQITIYDLKNKLLSSIPFSKFCVNYKTTDVTEDSQIILTLCESNLNVRNIHTGIDYLNVFDQRIKHAFFSSDYKKVVVMYEDKVQLIDFDRNILASKEINIRQKYNTIAYHPILTHDRRTIIFYSHQGVLRWDLEKFEEESSFSITDGKQINSIIPSPDGNIAIIDTNEGRELWDIRTGEKQKFMQEYIFYDGCFSFDSKKMLTVQNSGSSLKIWDIGTESEVFNLKSYSDTISRAIFTPRGKIVVSFKSGLVQVFDINSNTPIASFDTELKEFNEPFVSPDETIIYVKNNDKAILIPFNPLQSLIDKYKNIISHYQ